ncbi:MAG TPA: glycosyltransferase [Solirubrobacteraceae bacterium]|nr:glycosyltransferase [Solirubrobacteraceae bacterium]
MQAIIPERYGRGIVRVLVLSNMLPDAAYPERGTFVRTQVADLRRLEGLDIELYEFPPGGRALVRAAVDLRRRYGGPSTFTRRPSRVPFDVVHAHYGLTAWPSLAVPARVRALTVHGNDMRHPRTRMITGAALSQIDLLAAVSSSLAQELPGRKARARAQVLPCGVDIERFYPIPRAQARSELGLDPEKPYLLFAADPARAIKRYDLALALAREVDVELLVLGGIDPARASLWFNAVNAVLMPSGHEGFGLAVLEALACDVPVLATPVGNHPDALRGVAGTLCAPFELHAWRDALVPHLRAADSRIQGRAHAEPFSSLRMAERVAAAWRVALERDGGPGPSR